MNSPRVWPQADMPESTKRTLLSVGVGVGAAAMGAVAGVAASRFGASRQAPIAKPAEPGDGGAVVLPTIDQPLSGRPVRVPTSGGCFVHAVVDEPQHPDPSLPTIVMSHGFALSHEAWYFQRREFRDKYRMVVWDQRGHGASPRCAAEDVTIDVLGQDLGRVVDQVAPAGPLVLVGHSMGGMTVMAYAAQNPEVFRTRVIGVGLIATASFNLRKNGFGWGPLGHALHGVAPGVLQRVSSASSVVDWSRQVASRVEQALVRRYSFGSPVSDDVLQLSARLIRQTPLQVLSDYVGQFALHDKREALEVLHGIESLVLVGDEDLLTPPSYSDRIVRRLPHSEYVTVAKAGHLVQLEHPDVVNQHLQDLMSRSLRSAHNVID